MLSQFRKALGMRQKVGVVLGAMMLAGLPAPCIGQASQGMSPIARQRIHIALSVRPSFEVRQQQFIQQGEHPFCIWSNGSMHRYGVKLQIERKLANATAQREIKGQELECSKLVSPIEPPSGAAEYDSWGMGVVALIISPY